MKSTVSPPSNERSEEGLVPLRADEPGATVERAFDRAPCCPEWEMLSEPSQAKAYQVAFADQRVDRLIEWRDEIENDSSKDQQRVRDARQALCEYIVARFKQSVAPEATS